jgi:hypothetical protein
LSHNPQREIERHRRLDEIEAELKTIEKKLYWRQGIHWRAVLSEAPTGKAHGRPFVGLPRLISLILGRDDPIGDVRMVHCGQA